MNTTTYTYPDQPKAPTIAEVRHALLVVCQLLTLTVWGVGKTIYTLGQWCGHYYHNHEEVDAAMKHQTQIARHTAQYTIASVALDAHEVLHTLAGGVGEPDSPYLNDLFSESMGWFVSNEVQPALGVWRGRSIRIRTELCESIKTHRESLNKSI